MKPTSPDASWTTSDGSDGSTHGLPKYKRSK